MRSPSAARRSPGPTQDHILALARELGVGTFNTYDTGDNVYLNQGVRLTYPSNGPTGTAPPDPLILAELTAVVALLDEMSTQVPVDAPWTAAKRRRVGRPDARDLDQGAQRDRALPPPRARGHPSRVRRRAA